MTIPERDRWFESGSLQRGVRCEPDFRGRSFRQRQPSAALARGPAFRDHSQRGRIRRAVCDRDRSRHRLAGNDRNSAQHSGARHRDPRLAARCGAGDRVGTNAFSHSDSWIPITTAWRPGYRGGCGTAFDVLEKFRGDPQRLLLGQDQRPDGGWSEPLCQRQLLSWQKRA